MLAHKIFFTIVFSTMVNISSIGGMEKTEKVWNDEIDEVAHKKALRYVASVQRARHHSQAFYISQKKEATELPEMVNQPLSQRTIEFNAEQEIQLQQYKRPTDCMATFEFENKTDSPVFIDRELLKPTEKKIIEVPFAKLTDRLQVAQFPLCETSKVKFIAGRGPTLGYQKCTEFAQIIAYKKQIIAELPHQCFSARCIINASAQNETITHDEELRESDANCYYGSVILVEKNNIIFRTGSTSTEAAQKAHEKYNTLTPVSPRQPAFPAPKKNDEAQPEQKRGSLIYGSLRKLVKSGSSINVKEQK